MQGINYTTVKGLELLAPRTASEDAATIKDGIRSGKFFPLVRDTSRQTRIMRQIISVPHLIPTLWTFCEDTKYLEPIARCMGILVDVQKKETVQQALQRIYHRPNCEEGRLIQQDGENTIVEVEGNEQERFKLSFIQLVLKEMRSFPDMVNISCRKDDNRSKPAIVEPNAIAIHQLASLAHRLGFRSAQIDNIISRDPELYEMRTCLARMEPDEQLDKARLRREATELLGLWKNQQGRRTHTASTPTISPALVTEKADLEVSQRCGRPYDKAHRHDKKFLFLRWMVDGRHPRGRYITSFFVKRWIFIAFFIEKEKVPQWESPSELEFAYSLSVIQGQPQEATLVTADTEAASEDVAMAQNEPQPAGVPYESEGPNMAAPAADEPMSEAGSLSLIHGVSLE